jgi:hypothetical protein
MIKKDSIELEVYEAPECEVLELRAEGIVCASGKGDISDWEDSGLVI